MSGGRSPQPPRLTLLLAGLFLVGLAIVPRVVPLWSETIEGGRAIVWDPDACYHLRRAELIAKNFPDLAVFDSYINFPHGARVIWPPLYDVALAGALRAFPAARGARGLRGPSAAVALLPPVLCALTVLVVFALARRLWPGRVALPAFAAAVTAALPANRPYTIVGGLDHHAAELLLVALFLLALGDATERVREGGRPLRHALAPGAALAAALLVQLTLVVLVPLAFAGVLLGARRRPARALALLAGIHGVALLLVLPWAWAYASAGAPFRYYQFGLFQPAVLALAAAAAAGARAAIDRDAPRGARLGALLACGVVAAGLAVRIAGESAAGVSYVTGSYAAWQATIGESRSVLRMGFANGSAQTFAFLSVLVVGLPAACVHFARRARAGDGRRAVLLAATVVFAALGAEQIRFFPHLALLVGIAAATVVDALARAIGARPAAALAVLGAAAALLPTRPAWGAREEAASAFRRMRSVFDVIARATPPTSFYDRPTKTPEYGVLADWSVGHFVQYHARRAAVVDNFGFAVCDPTIVRRFYLETDEDRALAFLDSVRTPLVLVEDVARTFSGLIPDDSLRARYQTAIVDSSRGGKLLYFTEAILPTMLYRLGAECGGGGAVSGGAPGAGGGAGAPDDRAAAALRSGAPALRQFRLIAESAELTDARFGRQVPAVSLYEVVAAAWLRLDGLSPGSSGILRATIRTPRGRAFSYAQPLVADSAGTLIAALPYPTTPRKGASYAESAEVVAGDAVVPVTGITEAMVGTGADVPLPPVSAAGSPGARAPADRGSR